MKAIVITVGTALGSGLALVRSIKRKVGCKAFVLCTDARTSRIYAASRYIDEVHHIENGDNANDYVNSIKVWYQKMDFLEKPVLYFTTDTACFYIDKHRDWFEEHFELCLPSSAIIQTYTQKGLAEEDAAKNGLTIPKTITIDNLADIKYVVNNFSFPVIIKPRATYLKSGISFKIKVIENAIDFETYTSEIITRGDVSLLCQEFISGGDDTSYYYLFYRSKYGTIYENMGRKILQSTPQGGIMAKGVVEYNKNLSNECQSFISNIDYNGIGGIEFKKYNNKFYFIEMSTRLEGFFKIAEVSDCPLSLYSYYDLSNNKTLRDSLGQTNQKDGIKYMDFITTMINRIKYRKFISLVTDLFSALFNPRTKINIFASDDQKPFWMTLKNLIIR